jgi:Rrf2 family protein
MERSKRKTDFLTEPGFLSLAVLVEIIRQADATGAATPLTAIARKLGMSLSYAEKMAVSLRREGFVKTVRGVRGGFTPARHPRDIPVAAVIRATYRGSASRESGAPTMRQVQSLRIHLQDMSYRYLEKMSVADIMEGTFERTPHIELITTILDEPVRTSSASASRNGVIEQYWTPISMGSIRTDGGHSYIFHRSEWLNSDVEPEEGQKVSFEPQMLQATRIRPED